MDKEENHSKEKFDTFYNIEWGQSELSLLGIKLSTDKKQNTRLELPRTTKRV